MSTNNDYNNNTFFTIQLMGMINCLKTGDPTVDMLLAMVLPRFMSTTSSELIKYVKSLPLFKKKHVIEPTYTRTIARNTSQNSTGASINMDEDSLNVFLIKAIKLYVHRYCKLDLKDADMELVAIGKESGADSGAASIRARALLAARRSETGANPTVRMLLSSEIIEKPKLQQWHNLGVFGGHQVRLQMEDNMSNNKADKNSDEANGNKSVRSIKFCLESTSRTSINTFVDTAYMWYLKELQQSQNNDRYLFDLRGFNSSTPYFQCYKLDDEKTFETLFSKQSKNLLKIVNQFQEKKGKYAVKGYPHKLGLLLSGPPGTGKTSLIKALAHYTDRHIVNVPLSRVGSNAQLMDLFFNKAYQLPSNPTTLDFNKVIFVLEDVDASSDVVKSRKLHEKERKEWLATKDSTESRKCIPSISTPSCDKLNLTGLLNVLDGAVNTPGRIVIMSTNHPEMLDPALIRPGRIDKKLDMGYMEAVDAIAMIEHYYQRELEKDEKLRVETIFDDGSRITAAQVEQLASEMDNINELLQALNDQNLNESDSETTNSQETDTNHSKLNENGKLAYKKKNGVKRKDQDVSDEVEKRQKTE